MPILAVLQPDVTLELYLWGKGGAMCFPKQCLVPAQEAQHTTGTTGGSDGLLTHLIPGQVRPGPRGGPGSSSLEGTAGGEFGRGKAFTPFPGWLSGEV